MAKKKEQEKGKGEQKFAAAAAAAAADVILEAMIDGIGVVDSQVIKPNPFTPKPGLENHRNYKLRVVL